MQTMKRKAHSLKPSQVQGLRGTGSHEKPVKLVHRRLQIFWFQAFSMQKSEIFCNKICAAFFLIGPGKSTNYHSDGKLHYDLRWWADQNRPRLMFVQHLRHLYILVLQYLLSSTGKPGALCLYSAHGFPSNGEVGPLVCLGKSGFAGGKHLNSSTGILRIPLALAFNQKGIEHGLPMKNRCTGSPAKYPGY